MKQLAALVLLTLLSQLFPSSTTAGKPGDPVEDGAMTSVAEQVRNAEIRFARSMADRDLKAFTSFIDDEAIFFGGKGALRGRTAVVEAWSDFFKGETPPFSWQPRIVEVLDSGTLALSSGPVLDPMGKEIAVFNSIWRRTADGSWKVIFDKGSPVCAP
jgi:ketosteroid isomerase-like protein